MEYGSVSGDDGGGDGDGGGDRRLFEEESVEDAEEYESVGGFVSAPASPVVRPGRYCHPRHRLAFPAE